MSSQKEIQTVQNKHPIVVQNTQQIQESKQKVELYTLGEGDFVISQQEQEADWTDSRIGAIRQDGNGVGGPKLKNLWLRKNMIGEIRGLDALINLQELELYDNKILQIKGLDSLTNLELLDLSYNNIKKIQNLSSLPNLRRLFLLSNKIKKIENLDFPLLEMLELGSNKIRQIQNLEKLPKLKSLYLGKNRITEIKNLGHFKQLKQIALGPNRITKIENLDELKQSLEQLYLQENQVTKIQNVNVLKNLTILDISYNKVEHLQGMEQLVELDALYLTTNKIDNVGELKVLSHNKKLTTISLFGNDVVKSPDYRMKLVEMLPLIDDIDGTPMKTSYKIVFGSDQSIGKAQQAES